MRARGPTARHSRIINSNAFFDSPIRPQTVIRIEAGQNDDGVYSHFVRVWTAGVVTYEEVWCTAGRAQDRFERVVENHVEGRALNQ